MDDGKDLMALLPEHLRICILELLDAESLFNCIKVNRAWNEMTDNLQPKIWFEACLNAGIDVEEDTYHVASEWKAFFLTMVQRLRDMRTCNCYEIVPYPFEERPRVISCHNEKLAVAFSDYVAILYTWKHREMCVSKLPCDFESSFLKFDGNTLVAASTDGRISYWSFQRENQLNEPIVLQGILLSIDFLTEYSILVGSLRKDESTTIIYIWRIFGERISHIITVNEIIHRVLLAPKPDSPTIDHQGKTCFLFGLAEDFVRVWIVEIRSQAISAQISTTYIIPPDPNMCRDVDVDGTPHFGLLFDGTELFFTTQSLGRSPLIIWAWNFREENARIFLSDHPIINILGVGKKYLVYKLRDMADGVDTVCAVDKITNDIVAYVRAPRIDFSRNQISLGHTSWMDGLNGENDSGVVFASLQEDPLKVDVVSYISRH